MATKACNVEAIDALLEFANCMRDEGFDMPDPDPITGSFGELDKDDADFAIAYEQCAVSLDGGK